MSEQDTYAKVVAEAKMLGTILPCDWTSEQRDRVITLTGMSADQVDEIIYWSHVINGRR